MQKTHKNQIISFLLEKVIAITPYQKSVLQKKYLSLERQILIN